MTLFVHDSQTLKNHPIKKTIIQVAVVAIMATAAVGCSRGIKPVVNDPVKLVQIAQPVSVLQPVFSVNAGKNTSKKDPLDLQIGYDNGQVVVAGRDGSLTGFDNAGQRLWSFDIGEDITATVG